MRVLHVVPSVRPDRGGPARSVPELVRQLRRRGVEASLAAAGASGEAAHALETMSLPFEVLRRGAARLLEELVAASELVEIHSVWNATVTATAAMCRRRRVPYLITPRGMLDPKCVANHRRAKQLYRWMREGATLDGAAGFHFLSTEERDRAEVRIGTRRAAISPNGIDALPQSGRTRGALRSRLGLPTGSSVLLHLGRLDAIKGIELQMEALALMPEAERPYLVLMGPDFGAGPGLRALAGRLGVSSRISWADPVYGDERFALLGDADLVLLTSHYDCNPMVAGETLAAGGVLLATEGCGVAGLAQAGAAVVVPRDAGILAAELGKLLADPGRRAEIGRQGAAHARERLTWDRALDPLLELYEGLAAGSGR